jgi:dihydrofolate reductase
VDSNHHPGYPGQGPQRWTAGADGSSCVQIVQIGGWGGDHHDGVPIFVLSRHEPDSEMGQWPLVTYVSDVRTAMTQAKQAAGDKNVLVHGAGTAQLALAAGVLDELEIHLIPVLFGQGRRVFENLRPEQIELERTRILEGEDGVTHMHYRVQR